jgi:hypothetical protein
VDVKISLCVKSPEKLGIVPLFFLLREQCRLKKLHDCSFNYIISYCGYGPQLENRVRVRFASVDSRHFQLDLDQVQIVPARWNSKREFVVTSYDSHQFRNLRNLLRKPPKIYRFTRSESTIRQ